MKKTNLVNKNYQSTGNLFLDHITGGISIGTLVLLVEDTPTRIHESFVKYFLAEGLVNDQRAFVYSSNRQSSNIIKTLPYRSTGVESILNSKRVNETKSSEIKIAWRYENIKYANTIEDILKSTDYILDLSRTLQDNYVSPNTISFAEIEATDGISVLKEIINKISTDYTKFSETLKEDEVKFTRFVVPNLFEDAGFKGDDQKEILDLKNNLNALKNLARSINGIIYLTVSKEFLQKNILNLISYFSDYIFSIHSFFTDTVKLEEYDALLTINKLPRLCSMKSVDIETEKYGIIKEKRKIVIEKVDIGPEIDRNTKVKEKDLPISQAICGGEKHSKNYEF